jgi:transglutaminase-like putative cysteine protease
MRIIGKLIGLLFKLVAIVLMVGIPLLGVWVSSSMAVFANKGLPWAIGAGLLMFPVLPLLWEAWSAHRRKRKGKLDRRILNGFDRLVLRTLVLNGLFIGGLLATQPKVAFTALSARGDWMLGGASGPTVDKVRGGLFATVDALNWLYELAAENPHRDKGGTKPPPPPKPSKAGDTKPKRDGTKPKPGNTKPKPDGTKPKPDGTKPKPDGTKPKPDTPKPVRRWPQPAQLHPIVTSMPASAEASPQSVGKHIAAQTDDPFVRARAVHDYVADRIAYDAVALAEKRYPPYDAKTVLKRRMGVCAGYAKLFVAIAKAAGLKAVYLTGHARQEDGGIDGIGHAWNGIELEGKWYLLDPTWDSGSVKGRSFTKKLRTAYFLTPPKVFATDHFPDEKRWQLLAKPLSRSEFIRQPFMRSSFHAAGLKLISPRRPQVSVSDRLMVKIGLPAGTYGLVSAVPEGGSIKSSKKCKQAPRGSFDCRFGQDGRYTVHICINKKQRYGRYTCVGKILVNASP